MKSKTIHATTIALLITWIAVLLTSCSTVRKSFTKERSFKDSTTKVTTQSTTVTKTDSAAVSESKTNHESGVIIDFDLNNMDSVAANEIEKDISAANQTISIIDPSERIVDALIAKIKSGKLRPKTVHIYNNSGESKKDSVTKTEVDSTATASTDYTHVITETTKKSKEKTKTVPLSFVFAGGCILLLFLLLLLSRKLRDKITGVFRNPIKAIAP